MTGPTSAELRQAILHDFERLMEGATKEALTEFGEVYQDGEYPQVVYADRMIDDQIDGYNRIDLLGISTEPGHSRAHGGQINYSGHAGEILHQNALGVIGDLLVAAAAGTG